jgi:hypothetical protein
VHAARHGAGCCGSASLLLQKETSVLHGATSVLSETSVDRTKRDRVPTSLGGTHGAASEWAGRRWKSDAVRRGVWGGAGGGWVAEIGPWRLAQEGGGHGTKGQCKIVSGGGRRQVWWCNRAGKCMFLGGWFFGGLMPRRQRGSAHHSALRWHIAGEAPPLPPMWGCGLLLETW